MAILESKYNLNLKRKLPILRNMGKGGLQRDTRVDILGVLVVTCIYDWITKIKHNNIICLNWANLMASSPTSLWKYYKCKYLQT